MKNLQSLYKMQKLLMDRIDYKGKDRFDKTILALLVEVGECANEWRGFKYWAKDQQPRRYAEVFDIKTNRFRSYDSLLEEYVDGLHFVLQIGIELGYEHVNPFALAKRNTLDVFQRVYEATLDVFLYREKSSYEMLLSEYLSLGYNLGFTDKDITNAYIAKNEVNHDRQNTGY